MPGRPCCPPGRVARPLSHGSPGRSEGASGGTGGAGPPPCRPGRGGLLPASPARPCVTGSLGHCVTGPGTGLGNHAHAGWTGTPRLPGTGSPSRRAPGGGHGVGSGSGGSGAGHSPRPGLWLARGPQGRGGVGRARASRAGGGIPPAGGHVAGAVVPSPRRAPGLALASCSLAMCVLSSSASRLGAPRGRGGGRWAQSAPGRSRRWPCPPSVRVRSSSMGGPAVMTLSDTRQAVTASLWGPALTHIPEKLSARAPPAAPAPTHRPSDRRPQLRLRAPQLERGRRGWVPTLLGSVCSGELRGAHALQALFWESQGGVDFAGHPGPFGGQWGWRDIGQAGQGQKGGDEWPGLQGPTPAACGRPGRGGWPGPSDPHCRGVGATAPLERPRPQPAYSVSPSWGLLEDPPTRPRPCPWAETMASRPWGPGGPLSWSGDWLAGTGTLPGEPPVYALSL